MLFIVICNKKYLLTSYLILVDLAKKTPGDHMAKKAKSNWHGHEFRLGGGGSVALAYNKERDLFCTEFSLPWVEDGHHSQALPTPVSYQIVGNDAKTMIIISPQAATALRYLLNTSVHVPEHASFWRQLIDLIMSTPLMKHTLWIYTKEFQKNLTLKLGL